MLREKRFCFPTKLKLSSLFRSAALWLDAFMNSLYYTQRASLFKCFASSAHSCANNLSGEQDVVVALTEIPRRNVFQTKSGKILNMTDQI